MADKTPAMGDTIHPDALELANLLLPSWPALRESARRSGLVCEGDGGDGGAGDGGSGDGAAGKDKGGAGDAGKDGEDDVAGLSDAGKKALDAERKARRDAERRASAAEKKAQEFEERDLTEQQKLEKRAQDAEAEVGPTKVENLRLRVALDKKLPAELVDRLKGNTKEEIETDAEELLKLVKANGSTTTFDGGVRQEANTTDMDTLIRQRAGVG